MTRFVTSWRAALRTIGVTSIVISSLAACGASMPEVVTSQAAAHTLRYAPAGTGTVRAAVDDVVSVERRSTVLQVNVAEGQRVRFGQPLLRVYSIGESSAVAQAKNRLRADEKQLPFVNARFGKLSSQAAEQQARIIADRANLTRAKTTPTVLTAPAAGYVSGLSTRPGSTLERNAGALHVVDDDRVRVTVPLLVSYQRQVKVGQKAQLTGPAMPGRTIDAMVSDVGPSAGSQPSREAGTTVQTVPVTVALANPHNRLTPGSSVYVRFPLVRTVPVAVNSLAVLGQDRPFVLAVRNGVVHQVAVVVGASNGTWTEIQSGLVAGAEVVISGGHQLVGGSHVRVRTDT